MAIKKQMTFFPLILLIISAVASNRNLPSAAIFGAPLIFYFLLVALCFFLPVILTAAELGTYSSKIGGIYHWVHLAFGKKFAMVAIWLQWVNSIIWYPTILSFLAGTFSYTFNPEFMHNKAYNFLFITSIFWILTWINLYKIQAPHRLNQVFCLFGTILPMLALIILGFIWFCNKEPIQISLKFSELLPSANLQQWTILAAITSSLVRMELAAVHISKIKNAVKTFPRALLFAGLVIFISILLGSLSLALVVPEKTIHLAGGLMQYFYDVLHTYHLDVSIKPIAWIVVLGSLGTLVNWTLIPAQELHSSTQFAYLPTYFSHLNHHKVPSHILIMQAICVTIACFLLHLLPSVNAFYWFLMSLSCSLYMMLYILMFLSLVQLRMRKKVQYFHIPFGKVGLLTICAVGLLTAFITILMTHITPPDIVITAPTPYAIMMLTGNLLLIGPVFFFLKKRT